MEERLKQIVYKSTKKILDKTYYKLIGISGFCMVFMATSTYLSRCLLTNLDKQDNIKGYIYFGLANGFGALVGLSLSKAKKIKKLKKEILSELEKKLGE